MNVKLNQNINGTILLAVAGSVLFILKFDILNFQVPF